MSFIRKFKKGNQVYLAEVESIRINGKVKQKFIKYVGRELDGKTILSCSISDAKIESVKVSGPLMVLHSIATRIGLDKILGSYAHEILSMVYAHCLDYKSLANMTKWFKRTDLNLLLNLEELTEKRLVNALDSIENFNLMNLQLQIFESVRKVLNIKTHGIIYDVTNTYFYGKKCKIAKPGHDKEKRKGFPLVQIGLAVTQEQGIPIFHKTFPGNIYDSRTFSDVSKDLKKVGITKGIAIMDRGISSFENTNYLSTEEWKILCGLKNDEAIKKLLRKDEDLKEIESLKNRLRLNKTIFYCKEKSFKHGGIPGRLIVCYNKRKAQEKKELRFDEIEAAQICLKKQLSIKPELHKFFDKKGQLLESKLNQAGEFDGVSFIFTTSDLPLKEVIKVYFDKDVVEKAFQALKEIIRLRPVRLWLGNRVAAHIFICYLACLLLSILKNDVRDLGISFQKALDELEGLYRVFLLDPKTGFKLGRLVVLTKKQEKILHAVDKNLLKKCSE